MGMIKIAFENVLPYITNIEKLREILQDFDDCEEGINYIENLIEKTEDITIKTDLKILLNEVLRICKSI